MFDRRFAGGIQQNEALAGALDACLYPYLGVAVSAVKQASAQQGYSGAPVRLANIQAT